MPPMTAAAVGYASRGEIAHENGRRPVSYPENSFGHFHDSRVPGRAWLLFTYLRLAPLNSPVVIEKYGIMSKRQCQGGVNYEY